jgi:putative ABC transport system substrate-binding protein
VRWRLAGSERAAEIAAEFVRLKVDVILTVETAIHAVKHATSTIPIAFAIAVDPVGSGLVASLARPGGNVTGASVQQPRLPGNGSRFCMSCSRTCGEWRSSAMLTMTVALREIGEVQAAAAKLGLNADVS